MKGDQGVIAALAQADVLRALKRYRCLAKQDLVFCQYQDDPEYWRTHALARCSTYRWLERTVVERGVNQTYLLAVERYSGLPLFISRTEDEGLKEALEAFFLFTAGESPLAAKINV